MAIKRLVPYLQQHFDERLILDYFSRTGEIIVRSDLVDFAFKNSSSLITKQATLLQRIQGMQDIFHASTKGIYESNIVISKGYEHIIEDIFKEEIVLSKIEKLASVTLRSPEKEEDIPGIFFYITKMFQWQGVNIVEIISTKHEMTFLVHKKDVSTSFLLLQQLKEMK